MSSTFYNHSCYYHYSVYVHVSRILVLYNERAGRHLSSGRRQFGNTSCRSGFPGLGERAPKPRIRFRRTHGL